MKASHTKKQKINALLLASRITRSVIRGMLPLIFIPHIIESTTREEPYLPENNPCVGIIMTALGPIYLLGFIISWKKEGIGGILMVLAGLTVCIPFIIIEGNIGALIFGIPLAVSGLLYCVYWDDMCKSVTFESTE